MSNGIFNPKDRHHQLMKSMGWEFVKNVPNADAAAERRKFETKTMQGGSTDNAYTGTAKEPVLAKGMTAIWKRKR